jgi:hypothetical protein
VPPPDRWVATCFAAIIANDMVSNSDLRRNENVIVSVFGEAGLRESSGGESRSTIKNRKTVKTIKLSIATKHQIN